MKEKDQGDDGPFASYAPSFLGSNLSESATQVLIYGCGRDQRRKWFLLLFWRTFLFLLIFDFSIFGFQLIFWHQRKLTDSHVRGFSQLDVHFHIKKALQMDNRGILGLGAA